MAGYLDRISRNGGQGLRDDLRSDLAGSGYTGEHHTNTQMSFRSQRRLNTTVNFGLRDFVASTPWENPGRIASGIADGQAPDAYLTNMARSQARAIVAIQDEVSKSQLGRKMMRLAHQGGVQFSFGMLPEEGMVAGYLNRQRQGVYNINGDLLNAPDSKRFLANAAVDTAHELGHVVQDKAVGSDFDIGDYTISHQDRLLSLRHFEAGATAASIQVAWEIGQNGNDGAWQAISTEGPDTDCAAAFAAMAEADPASVRDGRARRAAHDAWFANAGRLNDYDDSITSSYRQILVCLAEQQAVGFPRKDAAMLVGKLGHDTLPDERLLAAAETPDGINHLTLPGHLPVRAPAYAATANPRIAEQIAFLDGIADRFRKGETISPFMLNGYDQIAARYDGTPHAQDYDIQPIGDGVPGEPDNPLDRISKRGLLGKWRDERGAAAEPTAQQQQKPAPGPSPLRRMG